MTWYVVGKLQAFQANSEAVNVQPFPSWDRSSYLSSDWSHCQIVVNFHAKYHLFGGGIVNWEEVNWMEILAHHMAKLELSGPTH